MGEEYKNHLKAMIPSLALYLFMLVMGFIVWDTVLCYMVSPYQREYAFMENMGYSHVVESSSAFDDYDQLVKLENIITFSNEQGKRMNDNVYIAFGADLFGDLNLQEYEIAVSEKMAERLGLSIGSTVIADYPIYDQPIEYTVKSILPYASDLYNSMDNQDFSYALVGDDGVLKNQAKSKKVYFLDSQKFNNYLSDENSYIGKYDMAEEKEAMFLQVSIRYVVMILIMLVLVISIAILMHSEINKEVLKYYYDGYEISAVKSIDRNDNLIFGGVPLLIQIAFIFIMKSVLGYSYVFLVCVVAILVIMLLITVFVGGRKYGKAA